MPDVADKAADLIVNQMERSAVLEYRVRRLLKLIRQQRQMVGMLQVQNYRVLMDNIGLRERVRELELELKALAPVEEVWPEPDEHPREVKGSWHEQADKSLAPPPKCKATRDAWGREHAPCILPEHEHDEPHQSNDGETWYADPLNTDVEG